MTELIKMLAFFIMIVRLRYRRGMCSRYSRSRGLPCEHYPCKDVGSGRVYRYYTRGYTAALARALCGVLPHIGLHSHLRNGHWSLSRRRYAVSRLQEPDMDTCCEWVKRKYSFDFFTLHSVGRYLIQLFFFQCGKEALHTSVVIAMSCAAETLDAPH